MINYSQIKKKQKKEAKKKAKYFDKKIKEFLKEEGMTKDEVKESDDLVLGLQDTEEFKKIVLFKKHKEKEIEKPKHL